MKHLCKNTNHGGNLFARMSFNRDNRDKQAPPTTFVSVQIVPQTWFPNISSVKTSRQRKTFEPVYDDNFDL